MSKHKAKNKQKKKSKATRQVGIIKTTKAENLKI